MPIVLFAIIGAHIKAGAWYWICYGIYVLAVIVSCVWKTIKEMI